MHCPLPFLARFISSCLLLEAFPLPCIAPLVVGGGGVGYDLKDKLFQHPRLLAQRKPVRASQTKGGCNDALK